MRFGPLKLRTFINDEVLVLLNTGAIAMINEPTVFILGAGANVPYYYPTGMRLRELICHETFSNQEFGDAISEIPIDCPFKSEKELIDSGKSFAAILSENPIFESIDAFLNRNRKYLNIGKIAIAYQILSAEYQSKKKKADQTQDWFSYLFHKMIDGLNDENGFEDFGRNKIEFITFNYDRSLEFLLYNGLRHCYYNATNEENNHDKLLRQLKQVPVHHVYGRVGNLLWESPPHYEYGKRLKFSDVWEMSKNIRIIDERIEEDEIKHMKYLISDYAKQVFFLGFGFAEENMNILELYNTLKNYQGIFGSALGLTEMEIRNNIYDKFRNKSHHWKVTSEIENKIILKNLNCLDLLRDSPIT